MSKPIPPDVALLGLEWRFELPETGCLISAWTYNEGNGYHFVKGHLAHRAAYTAAYGPIPEGMVIDHMCFTKSCVNPAHLRAISLADNTRRRLGIRFPFGQCRWGHPLSEQREFRRLGRPQFFCGPCMDRNNREQTQMKATLRQLELAYGLGGHETKKNYPYSIRQRDERVEAVRQARMDPESVSSGGES